MIAVSAEAGEPVYRTWTDQRQAQVEAALEGVNEDVATLRLRNGSKIQVPTSNLSAADRDWLAGTAAETASDAGDETSGAGETWPRTVALTAPPEVEVVKEDKTERQFRYETEHYEFLSDSMLGANLVREFSRVFEVTRLANVMLPLNLRPEPEPGREKFLARIFTEESDYLDAGGVPGSAGVYSPRWKQLMLPLASLGVKMAGTRVTIDYHSEDYATLIHEITHQMMNHWLDRLPVWYVEGAAEYVELAEYTNGRLSFLRPAVRLKNRLSRYSGPARFPMLPLERLMTIRHSEWTAALGGQGTAWQNYASALMLTYFFYHLDGDGDAAHFIAFLRAVEKLERGADFTPLVEEHLLRGRTYAQLEDELTKSLRRERVEIEFRQIAPNEMF